MKEVHEQFSPWASQVTRLYKDADYVEIEYTVGPIPIEYVVYVLRFYVSNTSLIR